MSELRGPDAAATNPVALAQLSRIFGDRCIIDDEKTLEVFSRDQVGDERYWQKPAAVVFPDSTDDVVALMKWANDTGTPVTPRGAGSGLAAAAIPVPGGVVCCFERMNRILEIDLDNLMVVVEPGVITNALDKALKPHGLFFAGYPMSEDICFIGGNVAENAGGGRAVKYGVTARYVIGAEVVTPDGAVLTLGGKLLKDVTGYNLLQLFIGSEGTLGLFTKIIIRVVPRPAGRAVLVAGFPHAREAAECVSSLKVLMANSPSSIEFMDGQIAGDTNRSMPRSARFSLNDEFRAYLLVEIEGDSPVGLGSDLRQAQEIVAKNAGHTIAKGADDASVDAAWRLRKHMPWWVKQNAGPWQTVEDVVVPPASVPDLVDHVDQLRDRFNVPLPLFGHAGDGNFHITPMKPEAMSLDAWGALVPEILAALYERVSALGGTISGEHGIGRKRVRYLSAFVEPAHLAVMRKIKETLDPNNILNPGVILEAVVPEP